MKVFMNLKWFFKQEKAEYLLGLLVLLGIALIQLVPPQIIGKTIDLIGTKKTDRSYFADLYADTRRRSDYDIYFALYMACINFWNK